MNVAEDHPLLPYVSKFGKMPDGDIAAQATSDLGRAVSARDVGKYRKYLGIEPFYPQRTLFETAPSPAADQDQIATSGTAVDGMEVPVPPSAGADVVDADDAFRRDAPKSKTSRVIPIDGIRTDGGTQARGSMNEDTVETYAEAMAEGVTFPPVVVYLDDQGDAWLADGFHRLAAAWKAGHTHINADVRAGSREDAVLFALSANATHGLARSSEDKRRAVDLLFADPTLGPKALKMSDREIGRLCAVSHVFVAKRRAALASREELSQQPALVETVSTEVEEVWPSSRKEWQAWIEQCDRPERALQALLQPGLGDGILSALQRVQKDLLNIGRCENIEQLLNLVPFLFRYDPHSIPRWPDEAPPAGFQAAVLRRLRSLLPKRLSDQIDEGAEHYANNIASEQQVLERLHDEMSDESLLMLMQIYTQAKSVGSSTFSRNQELWRNRLPPALRARMEEAVRQEREHEAARPPQPVPAWQAIEQMARDMTEDSDLPTGAMLMQLFLRIQSDRRSERWAVERVRRAIPEDDLRACPNPDCGAFSPVTQSTCVRCHLTPEQVESDRAIILARAVDILRKAHMTVGAKEYSCSVLSEEDGYAIVKLPLEVTALIRAGILYIADPCEE